VRNAGADVAGIAGVAAVGRAEAGCGVVGEDRQRCRGRMGVQDVGDGVSREHLPRSAGVSAADRQGKKDLEEQNDEMFGLTPNSIEEQNDEMFGLTPNSIEEQNDEMFGLTPNSSHLHPTHWHLSRRRSDRPSFRFQRIYLRKAKVLRLQQTRSLRTLPFPLGPRESFPLARLVYASEILLADRRHLCRLLLLHRVAVTAMRNRECHLFQFRDDGNSWLRRHCAHRIRTCSRLCSDRDVSPISRRGHFMFRFGCRWPARHDHADGGGRRCQKEIVEVSGIESRETAEW
jgi:hypothetical protein